VKHQIKSENVSRETWDEVRRLYDSNREKLCEYRDLLIWWNKKINLLSRNISEGETDYHIVHSLYPSISEHFTAGGNFLDIGSGGGLPGIPLAICYPGKQFVLLDKVQKKCFAAENMVKKLGLSNVQVIAGDLNMFHVKHPETVILSKHAFKLNEFINLSQNINWNKAVFLKGSDVHSELKEVEKTLKVTLTNLTIQQEPFFDGKYLVEIKKP